MTKKEFLDDFAEDLKVVLQDVYTKNTIGEEVGVTVYKNRLPVVTEDEEDESQYFPYAIARLSDALTDEEKPWQQRVYVLLGVYDDDLKGGGYLHILTMMERITNRYLQEPLLNHKYRAEPKMSTDIQDEDTYPYYFGAVEMTFNIPKLERRDEFS